MSEITLTKAELAIEKDARNVLFSEIEQEALRVSYECAENPIDEFPLQFGGNIFGYLLPHMREYQTNPISWRSVHAYPKNDTIEASVFYEQRAKGFGHYYRLRTATVQEEVDGHIMDLTDFAIKTTAPKRSIRWSIARILLDGDNPGLLELDVSHTDDPLTSLLKGGLVGDDLTPDQWHPKTNEDYTIVKGRLLHVVTLLSKLSCKTVIQTPADLPPVLRQPISYPLYYNIGGIGPSRSELASRATARQ